MSITAQRLLILGLTAATWTVLDLLRKLGLMPKPRCPVENGGRTARSAR